MSRYISVYITKIKAEITLRTENLVSTLASDYTDYRARVAHIKGLEQSLAILEEFLRSDQDDDDDDEFDS